MMVILVLISFGLTTFSLGFDNLRVSSAVPMKGITVDGTITEAEWQGLDWKVPFYLDIDDAGNPPDTDGFNYFYLGEDLSNVYIGLDLCSDRTGGTNGEWVGVWLNINNRTFTNSIEWEQYIDDGVETLVYDVEKDQEMKFLSNTISGTLSYVNDDSEYAATYGTISGNTTHLRNLDGIFFNVTAEFVGGFYVSRVEFTIDTLKWFSLFQEIFASNIQWINFQIYTKANDTISEHSLYLAYSDGTINPNDPDQVKGLSTTTSLDVLDFTYRANNLSANNEMKFVLYANHTAPFMTQIDSLHIIPYYNHTNAIATVTYPYTSINNYNIEWSFGPSFNNATNHRMYEIRIPKSDLEHYDPNEALGIIVGGYGTMSFPNTNYWVFSQSNLNIIAELSSRYLFFDMYGCTAQGPAIYGYQTYLIFSIIGLASILLIIKKYRNPK
jgi:hypothetical protein